MFFRTANLAIKEVYDCSIKEQLDSFKTRVASLKSSEKFSESSKHVIANIEPHFIYVVTAGLHGDEANDNGDLFRWFELLRKKNGAYMFESWIGKPVLENHDPKKIRGQIVDSFPIKSEKSIDFLLRIDERINPNMAKGIRNKSITGTSMGVLVGHSYCGICGNLAYDETEWCNHISPNGLHIKGKMYTGQDGNKYLDKVGQMVYEDNRDLEGVEDSIISWGEPADPKAFCKQILASKI